MSETWLIGLREDYRKKVLVKCIVLQVWGEN